MLSAREEERKRHQSTDVALSLVSLSLFLLLLPPQNKKTSTTTLSTHAHFSILYQRGVYPPESFQQKKQYGLSLTVTSDDKLASYLATVLEHLERWLGAGALRRLVLVIAGSPEGDVLERWTFDVQTDAAVVAGEG